MIPILFNFQCVIDGATSNNLTHLIVESLIKFGRLSETKMATNLFVLGQME
jgi:hypothetical protein